MKHSCLITIGTTPANLINLLRGTVVPAGASVSRDYGNQLSSQCRELQFKVDTGTIYFGDDSAVSATDYGSKLVAGESKLVRDSEANSISMDDYWIVAAAANAKISVEWTVI